MSDDALDNISCGQYVITLHSFENSDLLAVGVWVFSIGILFDRCCTMDNNFDLITRIEKLVF